MPLGLPRPLGEEFVRTPLTCRLDSQRTKEQKCVGDPDKPSVLGNKVTVAEIGFHIWSGIAAQSTTFSTHLRSVNAEICIKLHCCLRDFATLFQARRSALRIRLTVVA